MSGPGFSKILRRLNGAERPRPPLCGLRRGGHPERVIPPFPAPSTSVRPMAAPCRSCRPNAHAAQALVAPVPPLKVLRKVGGTKTVRSLEDGENLAPVRARGKPTPPTPPPAHPPAESTSPPSREGLVGPSRSAVSTVPQGSLRPRMSLAPTLKDVRTTGFQGRPSAVRYWSSKLDGNVRRDCQNLFDEGERQGHARNPGMRDKGRGQDRALATLDTA